MLDYKSSWTTGFSLKENIWSENSVLRAKVAALEKEVYLLRAERETYSGIATALVADSQVLKELLATREEELLLKYRNAGASLGGSLHAKLLLWKNKLYTISKNATTLAKWIAQDIAWDGTRTPTVSSSQPQTFLGTGLG